MPLGQFGGGAVAPPPASFLPPLPAAGRTLTDFFASHHASSTFWGDEDPSPF